MYESYVELVVAHPLWSAFVQFALLGTLGERMLIVVDIGRLMLSPEMALVDEVEAVH